MSYELSGILVIKHEWWGIIALKVRYSCWGGVLFSQISREGSVIIPNQNLKNTKKVVWVLITHSQYFELCNENWAKRIKPNNSDFENWAMKIEFCVMVLLKPKPSIQKLFEAQLRFTCLWPYCIQELAEIFHDILKSPPYIINVEVLSSLGYGYSAIQLDKGGPLDQVSRLPRKPFMLIFNQSSHI